MPGRRSSRIRLAATAGALLAIALPAAAAAQTPIDVGQGRDAHLAVDGTGAAHIAWTRTVSGGADLAVYCKVGASDSGCPHEQAFAYTNDPNEGLDSGVWPLLPGDGRVLLLDARCCAAYARKFVYTSHDAGASFGALEQVGEDDNSGASIRGAALYAAPGLLGRPAESLLTFGDIATLGLSFQATGSTGPPVTATPNNVLTQGDATSGSLGLSGNTLVAAWTSIDDLNVYWRMWTGSGDVNDSSNWTPITSLDTANIDSNSRLASGPGGIFIAYNTGGSNAEQIVLRQFTGNGWGPAIALSEKGNPRFFDIAEDQGGALHFAWQDTDRRLRYRSSSSSANTNFGQPQTLVESNANGSFLNVRLGFGGGRSWATWEDSSPAQVRALRIEAAPVEGKTANAVPVKGKVRVKLPPGAARAKGDARAAAGFVPLEQLGEQIPIGSTLDTTKGTVKLTLATNKSGGTQTGQLSGSQFVLGQRTKNPLTTLSMTGGGLAKCPGKAPRGGSPKAVADARKRRRSLFGNVRGHFRTRGRHSTATVRGTKYTVTDTCAGTLTKVKSGRVVVRDLVRKRTRKLKAGQSYFARRRHG